MKEKKKHQKYFQMNKGYHAKLNYTIFSPEPANTHWQFFSGSATTIVCPFSQAEVLQLSQGGALGTSLPLVTLTKSKHLWNSFESLNKTLFFKITYINTKWKNSCIFIHKVVVPDPFGQQFAHVTQGMRHSCPILSSNTSLFQPGGCSELQVAWRSGRPLWNEYFTEIKKK